MNLLFIADPLESFKTYKDSTYAMMAEAARRGHGLHAMLAADLLWRDGRVQGKAFPVTLTPAGQAPWFERGEAHWHDLAAFDAVLMRTDPPFDAAYLTATWLLEMAERLGARVFNRPQALRDFNEKLAIARFPAFTAPSLVSGDPLQIRAFLQEQGDIVVKPLDAMGGAGVFRLRPDDANLGAILETSTAYGARAVMAQRYLPEIKEGDKRVLVIDGAPVPYALARIPAPGETRGNLAAGGTGVARPLTARDREIAESLGPTLRAAGILLAGLDVIGDCLTEVNVTSPTCFREITAQTGFDVAGMFMDALERCVKHEA
ncbi:MAG: glutathione synthase [Betaproteobacteria bacterium]|nr:glutathione synthase [Betaproteobacteria bacterium]